MWPSSNPRSQVVMCPNLNADHVNGSGCNLDPNSLGARRCLVVFQDPSDLRDASNQSSLCACVVAEADLNRMAFNCVAVGLG